MKAGRRVIGDEKYVQEVIASAEARRLRISRFEREGCRFDGIAERIDELFDISTAMLQKRQCGVTASEARKAFSYMSEKEYKAPIGRIGEYLGVGNAEVSAMIKEGRERMEVRKITV